MLYLFCVLKTGIFTYFATQTWSQTGIEPGFDASLPEHQPLSHRHTDVALMAWEKNGIERWKAGRW